MQRLKTTVSFAHLKEWILTNKDFLKPPTDATTGEPLWNEHRQLLKLIQEGELIHVEQDVSCTHMTVVFAVSDDVKLIDLLRDPEVP